MQILKRILTSYIFYYCVASVLTLVTWFEVVQPIKIVIKKTNMNISVDYNGHKLEKKLTENKKIDSGTFNLQVIKPREFAIVGFLFPKDQILLDKANIFKNPNYMISDTSYFRVLLNWIGLKRDGDFSSIVSVNDIGENVEITSLTSNHNYEIIINTTGISILNFSDGDSTVFIRPNWHHEYELKVDDKVQFGGPIGLEYNQLFRRLSIFWLFLSTWLIAGLLILIVFIFIFKIPHILFKLQVFNKSKLLLNKLFTENFKKIVYFLSVFLILVLHFFITFYVATRVLDAIPHSQDEVSYLYQGKLLKTGKIFLEPYPKALKPFFYHEFIIDDKVRTGIYTLGAPLLFALGFLFNSPHIINPIISFLTLILLMYLVKKFAGRLVSIIVGIFYATSFFTIMQSASFFSHTITQLFILIAFILSKKIQIKYKILVGVSIGYLFITRPFDGVLMTFFICIKEIFSTFVIKQKLRNTTLGNLKNLLTNLSMVIIGFLPFIFLQLAHNYLVSGNIFIFPINVYSPFTKLGFGLRGVEWAQDFTFVNAFETTLFYLNAAFDSFFAIGFPILFMVFALLGNGQKIEKNRENGALLVNGSEKVKDLKILILELILLIHIFVVGYIPFYANGTFYGPRYWYGITFAIYTLSAIGLINIYRLICNKLKIRSTIPLIIFICVIIYFNISLILKLELRFKNFNGINKVQNLANYAAPTIVMVNGKNVWQSYSRYFILMSPDLTDNVIYAINKGISPKYNSEVYPNSMLLKYFPDRQIIDLNTRN